jgi:hypothetical protein
MREPAGRLGGTYLGVLNGNGVGRAAFDSPDESLVVLCVEGLPS